MEEEIKPKIVSTIDNLTKDYIKLQKYQKEKLICILEGKELSTSKNKNFKKHKPHWLIILKIFSLRLMW